MDPTKRPSTVDLNNLSSLTDKIHVLSALGGKPEDDRLGIDDLSSNLSENPVGDAALALASLSNLDELKGVDKLSLSIATATSTHQQLAESTILHHGLSSLPLEILSLIRVWLHVLENDTVYANSTIELDYFPKRVVQNTSFPLVCRRFREVELSTPELWTTVTKDMTFEQVKLHIARSGDLPLRVQINLYPYWETLAEGRDFCQCDLWELLASHAQRCEWMDIHVWSRHGSALFWHSDVRNCFNIFDGIHLSKLHRFHVGDVASGDEAILSTMRTWSMPHLSELFCDSPVVLFALSISHPLDVLKLIFDYGRLNTNDLMDLLSSPTGSNLQTLDLDLMVDDFRDTQSTSRAVLHTLKSFNLHPSDISDSHLHSLLQRIRAPSTERISVKIWRRDYHLVDHLVEWISSQRNPNLRNVNVQLIGCNWDREKGDNVYSKIVDAISLENDPGATLSNLPVVSVKAPDLDW